MNKHDKEYWCGLDEIFATSKIIIERPKGTSHPKFKDFIYPVDYGYLENTKSMDGNGIDIFVGTKKIKSIDAICCNVDLMKRDSEIKVLYGCTKREMEEIYKCINSQFMKSILITRN